MDGRTLHFRLGGINNQNFLMFDEETGSWWQQITGECLFGPLKGKRLDRIPSDEVSLKTWRAEHPGSTAVRFEEERLEDYAKSDWEERIGKLPVNMPVRGDAQARELIVGLEVNGQPAAFPISTIRKQSPINHAVGGAPVLVVVALDGNSVRTFWRTVGDRTLEFYRKPSEEEFILIDDATGSQWNFAGKCLRGPLEGSELRPIQNIKEFWFDWQRYHPRTTLYRAGEALRK